MSNLLPQSERELIIMCESVFGALRPYAKKLTQGDSGVSADNFDCYFEWKNGWHSRVWLDYSPAPRGRISNKVVGIQVVHTLGSQIVSFETTHPVEVARELADVAFR